MANKLQVRHKISPRVSAYIRVRSCLMCGKTFRSAGPHNRRCGRCSRRMAHDGSCYYEPTIYSFYPMERGHIKSRPPQ